MILAFDIGNSSVAAGVYGRGILLSHWKLRRPPSARGAWWKELAVLACVEAGTEPARLEGCVISSVVPAATRLLSAALRRLTREEPLIVNGTLPLGIRFAYDDPARLGPDRVCGMLAGSKKYGTPVIVVDCGTAITVDGVGRRNRHAGGMIAPGIGMSAAALGRLTAALPRVDWSVPSQPAGIDTVGGIRSGVWFGAVGGVRENVRQLKAVVGPGATVVGTGGDAPALMKAAKLFDVLDQTLVLDGAAAAWRAVAGNRRPGRPMSATSRRRGAKR